jgi:hypothetical protein
MILLVKPH